MERCIRRHCLCRTDDYFITMMKKNLSLPALLLSLGIGLGAALALAYFMRDGHELMATVEQKAGQASQQVAAFNAPPRITWIVKPETVAEGRVRLSYRIDASAPLTSVRLRLTPIIKAPGLGVEKDVVDVNLFGSERKTVNWDGHMDLTGSLLAGSPATLCIEATDKDRRVATSEEFSVTLPERHFANPMAKSIYDLRKSLMADPQKRLDVLRGLAGVLQQRENFKDQSLTLLTLRSAAVRIALDKSDDGLRSALDLLWHAALLFEENTVRVAITS